MSNGRHVWSFFTGAMGLDLGLEAAGFRPTLAVELDPTFVATIRRNRPRLQVVQADVASLDGKHLRERTGVRGDIELLVGGPPCQSFSPGGKRAALSDPRGNLIFEYLRLIGDIRPKHFILENVANLVTAAINHRPIHLRPGKRWNLSSYSDQPTLLDEDGIPPLTEDELSGSAVRYLLRTAITDLGYSVSFGVLNAADYGVPQRRLRFTMIGSRDDTAPSLPQPTHGDGRLMAYSTLKDAISDLRDNPGPGSEYTDPIRDVFRLVPEGGNWRDLPEEIGRRAMGEKSWNAGGGKTGFFRRLAWDQPAPTITGRANRKGSAICHPEFDRPLSVAECARIQGFPDHWIFEGSMNKQYMQIGNAVPVGLGEALGRALLNGPADIKLDNDSMLDHAVTALKASARNRRYKADQAS